MAKIIWQKVKKMSSGYQTVAWIQIGIVLIFNSFFSVLDQKSTGRLEEKNFRQPSGAFIYYSPTETSFCPVFLLAN